MKGKRAMQAVPAVLLTYIEGLKTHDVDKIAGTVSEDLAFVTATQTLSKPLFLAMLRALYAGFPDWHYDHDAPELRGEVIAIKWRQGGTHTGTFAFPGHRPVAATGIRVTIPPHYFFYRIQDGFIREIRPEPVPGGAPGGILEQLGAAPQPL
jgi:hypothetical protein